MFFVAWALQRPKVAMLASVSRKDGFVSDLEASTPFEAELELPVQYETHYQIARKIVSALPVNKRPKNIKFLVLNFEDVTMKDIRITGIRSQTSMRRKSESSSVGSALENALKAATDTAKTSDILRPSPVTKATDEESDSSSCTCKSLSTSSTNRSQTSSSSSSEAPAPKPKPKPTAFFTRLGIHGAERAPAAKTAKSKKATCRICGFDIEGGDLRMQVAIDLKRPMAYTHAG